MLEMNHRIKMNCNRKAIRFMVQQSEMIKVKYARYCTDFSAMPVGKVIELSQDTGTDLFTLWDNGLGYATMPAWVLQQYLDEKGHNEKLDIVIKI